VYWRGTPSSLAEHANLLAEHAKGRLHPPDQIVALGTVCPSAKVHLTAAAIRGVTVRLVRNAMISLDTLAVAVVVETTVFSLKMSLPELSIFDSV